MAIKLIIGLKNPGPAYTNTRHNAGSWFVELVASYYRISFKSEKKLHAELAIFEQDNQACRLLLPTTFMNHSGIPTQEVSQFYRIEPDEILVVHDELDLPAGRIKLKTGGGHGGHNGLRDIANRLGSSNFHRLRVGIGHPGHKDLVLNYVLGKPSSADKELILATLERTMTSLPLLIKGDLVQAMNKINS
ncbi:peptidyl-tRNA hydrolase [Legionella beliardensis]|uniref:Peptidyl-tRNA hydrolase n=1 Tax=Legionella beliardensis TaxID=91822 RepID=A0A378HZ90_9GAMM|nr:aminoacyl-tRNA hydrolase [Legionella beliardensis]STX28072.1 peptidyl-tRNA hydrolase [Legionella beliardensis]